VGEGQDGEGLLARLARKRYALQVMCIVRRL
jgi:hypothetical protein